MKADIRRNIIAEWQNEWASSTKGPQTHQYIPTVSTKRKSYQPFIIQFLSGLGRFPSYFKKFGITNNPHCDCGEVGTPDHYAFECIYTQSFRFKLKNTPTRDQIIQDPSNLHIIHQIIAIGVPVDDFLVNAVTFANNTILFASTSRGLQEILNHSNTFLCAPRLSIDFLKSFTLSFVLSGRGKKVKITSCSFRFGNTPILHLDVEAEWTYLEVPFTSTVYLMFLSHCYTHFTDTTGQLSSSFIIQKRSKVEQSLLLYGVLLNTKAKRRQMYVERLYASVDGKALRTSENYDLTLTSESSSITPIIDRFRVELSPPAVTPFSFLPLSDPTKFQEHYSNRKGSGIPYYERVSFQKGYGLGGIFRRWFRTALPFLVKGGKAIGKEALVSGTNVIYDVSGEEIKIVLKKRSKESGKNLDRKAIVQVQSMIGKGKYKRKRKQEKILSSKVQKRRGKEMRDISLNAHYMFLFKNHRDRSQIMHLGSQLCPNNVKFFREVYENAISKAFSYLLVDLTPQIDDTLRLRTGLFPGDKYYVYQPLSSFRYENTMTSAVLDFEGFQLSPGRFIVKEMAVCSVNDGTFYGRWLFKSLHSFESLNRKKQSSLELLNSFIKSNGTIVNYLMIPFTVC
ncbi:Retrovirus-related Pol polyprotein type-2 like protein [Argiope bruennichi]|uniref:Retrovirus-related Pol polyprotein type-2 like protein n=1 Tax=Argiope bruennichi TaxID=94029 RepID=A0A8T0EUM4_ARGBR|nr:Retrovirus-related Pol polyprotein type-2 like protein [Argiope bruennichi]